MPGTQFLPQEQPPSAASKELRLNQDVSQIRTLRLEFASVGHCCQVAHYDGGKPVSVLLPLILAYHVVRAPPKDYNGLIVIVARMPSRIRTCVRMRTCLASSVLSCLSVFRAPPMDYNWLIVIVVLLPSRIRMCVRMCVRLQVCTVAFAAIGRTSVPEMTKHMQGSIPAALWPLTQRSPTAVSRNSASTCSGRNKDAKSPCKLNRAS